MKIFYTVLGITCFIFLISCNDFLDKEVLANATDKTYYNTQYKMQSTLDAAYDVYSLINSMKPNGVLEKL